MVYVFFRFELDLEMEVQDTMNPKNINLVEVETICNSWKEIKSEQTVCAFYKVNNEDGIHLSIDS